MSQQELLKLVVSSLDRLQIAYFVTGSWSSSLLGEPRSTHDLDLVVHLDLSMVDSILESFADGRFYLSSVAVREAIQNRGMFNLLDLHSGDKVDFWMLTEEPWDLERFRRRETTEVFGIVVSIPSPEDTILAKLRWAKRCGGSEKQMHDARGVYEVQRPRLNLEYIEHWAKALDVNAQWNWVTGST